LFLHLARCGGQAGMFGQPGDDFDRCVVLRPGCGDAQAFYRVLETVMGRDRLDRLHPQLRIKLFGGWPVVWRAHVSCLIDAGLVAGFVVGLVQCLSHRSVPSAMQVLMSNTFRNCPRLCRQTICNWRRSWMVCSRSNCDW